MQSRRRLIVAVVIAAVAVAIVVLLRGHHGHREQPASASRPGTVESPEHAPIAHPPAGRRVAGQVLLDDAPAAGAVVRIDEGAPVRADATGHFDLGVQRIATHVVVAEAQRVTGAFRSLDLADPSIDPEHLVLVMHPCSASLHGMIRDAAGGPIAHARIAVASDDDRPGAGVESADDGHYDLCLAERTSFVLVSADGYARTKASIVAAGQARRDFMLVPEVPIDGHVVRATDQLPVPDAEVSLSVARPGELALSLRAISDGDGKFHISGAPPGRHSVSASAGRFESERSVPVLAELGAPPEDVLVEVTEMPTVSGKVVRGTTPVSGAWVALTETGIEWTQSAYSQADGTFAIERVSPGHYSLHVAGTVVADARPLDVARADIAGLVLDVKPAASIAGRVTRDGKPVEGASVQSDDGATTTDSTGEFTLTDLGPGEHRIYAESNRLGVFTRGPTITLSAGEQRTGVQIEMEISASIAGTVVDQDGAPVSGVIVRFSLVHGEDYGQATTAEDGTFSARGLLGGTYACQVQSADRSWSYSFADGKHLFSVTVADGQTHVTGVRIRIRRERKVIAGHVTTTAGAPVADAVVRAEVRDQFVRVLPAVNTDASGAFRLEDVPPGTYSVIAWTARGEERAVNVAAGRTDVTIQMPEAATIDGRLEGFRGFTDVLASRKGQVEPFQASVRGTTFTLRAIPPGDYEVTARGVTEQVSVAPGGHATVVLRERGRGAIAGTVMDERRTPLAGLRCSGDTDFARTDEAGHFRLDDVPSGKQEVFCYGPSVTAEGTVMVVEGETAALELTGRSTRPLSRSGMKLETQFEQAIVSSVDSGGPADKAGIHAGDVIVSVGGMPMSWAIDFDRYPAGITLNLVLERAGNQLSAALTLAPR